MSPSPSINSYRSPLNYQLPQIYQSLPNSLSSTFSGSSVQQQLRSILKETIVFFNTFHLNFTSPFFSVSVCSSFSLLSCPPNVQTFRRKERAMKNKGTVLDTKWTKNIPCPYSAACVYYHCIMNLFWKLLVYHIFTKNHQQILIYTSTFHLVTSLDTNKARGTSKMLMKNVGWRF